jgi:hypothetical protein
MHGCGSWVHRGQGRHFDTIFFSIGQTRYGGQTSSPQKKEDAASSYSQTRAGRNFLRQMQDSRRWARPPMASLLLGVCLFSSVRGLAMGGLELPHSPLHSGLVSRCRGEWGPGAHRLCLNRMGADISKDECMMDPCKLGMHGGMEDTNGDDLRESCLRSTNLRLRGGGIIKKRIKDCT